MSQEDINDLKKIREDKGLSLSDVADKLKLTSDVIKKLENSEFKTLGAYTYIRGYLMHYTDLLGIKPDKYIDMIPKSEVEIPLINTHSSVTKGIKFRKQSKNMASYLIGTSIVLVVSFSGWYLLKNNIGQTRSQLNTLEIATENTLEVGPKNTIELNDSPEKPNNDTESFHYSSLIPTNENSNNGEDSATAKKMANVNSDEINIPIQALNELNEQEVDVINNYAYEILVKAEETSWVKIEHLDGNKIHNDLFSPGQMKFESDKPIHFRIGNRSKVEITINGETIDLSQFSRKNIADFNWPIDS